MKTKTIGLTALGLILAIGIGLYSTGSFSSLEGRFGLSSPKIGVITMALSPSSPSGGRSVSTVDSMIGLTASANGPTSLPAGSVITFAFNAAEGDIDPLSAGDTVSLSFADVSSRNGYTEGATIGTGTISVTNAYTATAIVTTTSKVTITPSTPVDLTLKVNSVNLVSEDPEEDPVITSATYNGKTVTGNIVNY